MLPYNCFVDLIASSNCRLPERQQYNQLNWSDNLPTLRSSLLPFPDSPADEYGPSVWQDILNKKEEYQQQCLLLRQQGKRARIPMVSYESASTIARTAGITTMRQWFDHFAGFYKPLNLAIPGNPVRFYDSWVSWSAFLGTNNKAKQKAREGWLSYEEAKEEVRSWRITTVNEYQEFIGTVFRNNQLPLRPDHVYSEQWTSWSDFLYPRFVSYEKAKELMKPLGLRTEADFRKLGKDNRPIGVPSSPYSYYEEFESWADFLGYSGPVDYQKRRS